MNSLRFPSGEPSISSLARLGPAPGGAPIAPGGATFAPGEAPPAPGGTLKFKVDHFLHCSLFFIAHFCTSLTLKFMLKVQYHWKVREMLQNDIHEVKSWI